MYSAKSSKNPSRQYTPGICIKCGEPTKRTTRKYCSRLCAGRSGPDNPSWKGGLSREPVRYTKRFKDRYPLKARAHQKVYEAIKIGRLVRQPCEACGRSNDVIEAHHMDYAKSLDVTWLCDRDHKLLHRLSELRKSIEGADMLAS